MAKWLYKSTVKKHYGLTENQLRMAIEKGLIKARQVRNPYYTSKPSTLLLKEDVETHLGEIRALPKYSEEEKERRRVYGQRSRLRGKLEFFCPRCKRKIRALRGSAIFEECFRGGVSAEEARRVLMIAHYRHAHTDYENELFERKSERYQRYRELREEGYDFDLAWMVVDDELPPKTDEEIRNIKAEYNKLAIKLLKEDGLL